MAIIKKFAPFQNLSNFEVFLNDTLNTSQYFRVTEFEDTFTGGKNGFLIEGSEFLKESTEVKIEILDVEGNPIYFEPGDGVPEYYEGNSKLISVHVYDDTPIGLGKVTILGELKNFVDENGATVPIPNEWKGVYNVKWERTFQINKNINNETIVRFYKRPSVTITELVKPIFSKTIPTVTDTGYVHGISEVPALGTDIRTWRAGTFYKLQRTSGSWDRDVDENTITVTSPAFSGKIIEVLNDTEVLVDVPYTPSNIVSDFISGSYSVTYSDFNNQTIGETTLTGSFAKIDISQLKTFVGDVARVKVFRKSRNAVGDFQFVQESKLESSELLRDITTQNDTELSYGRFDESNLSTYWVSSSNAHPLSIDSSILSQAVKFDYNTVAGGVQQLITSESISLSSDVEYTLNFKTILSGSLTDTSKSIRAFFSSSNFTQDFLTISGSAVYRTRQDVTKNIISQNTGDAKLVFEVQGDDWYISNASLKNAQETSFSPDEFVLIQDIPRKTASETFDFRFEFYDINNNYIPVDVTAVGVFDGGNDFPSSGKLLTFESDRNAFRFSSGSFQNPTGQQIQLKVTQNNLTGSVTFASSAFDVDGNYLNPSDYSQYPGKLTSVNSAGAIITINNFTGSRTDGLDTPFVGSIVYTASLENLEEFETVYRLEDGDNAPQLIVTSNANQFIYEPTTLSPKPSGQNITVRAQRKNLASLITPIEVNSGSNRPELTFVNTVGGIDTYTISATQFSQSFAANNFDEVTYSFTGSDVFGNSQTDEITLSKVINFDAVSIILTNESTSFPAKSTGEVTGGFNSSSGSVQMYIGGTQITHDDYDSDSSRNRNTFDIKTITAAGVTATDTSPNTENYSISAFDTTKDSGSLTLDIEYLAGDNSTSQSFQKVVSYTKAKKAVPVVLTKTSPSSQTINSSSLGFESPQNVEVIVQEGGTEYTHDNSLSGGGNSNANKFKIVSISSGSQVGTTQFITPTTQSIATYSGTIGSASLNYVDSEGTYVTDKLVRFDVSVSKTGTDGQDGFSTSLTNQSHVFTANSEGTITSVLADGAFEARMFKGTTQFTFDNTLPYGADTYRINSSASGITISESTVSNQRKFTPTAVSANSGSVDVTIIDNASGVGFEHTYTFTKATAGAPAVNISANPQTQTVTSNNTFSSVTAPSNVTISVTEGGTSYTYDNSSPYDNQSFRITGVTNGTNNNDGTITPSTPSDGNTQTSVVTLTYKNSEGTEVTGQTIDVNVQAIPDPNPPLSPTSLIVSSSFPGSPFDTTPGTTSVPAIAASRYGLWNGSGTAITTNTDFDNIGYLGLGSLLTSDNNFSTDMKVYCQNTAELGDVIVLYQDENNYGNYTLQSKTNADGSGDTVLRLTYVSSAGTLTVQSLDYIGFGRALVGPGVVYRGEYDATETYYYTETRRDVVEGSDGEYYLAGNPSDSGTSNWDDPTSGTDWESFGANFSSVATDILFAQDVYANRTVNIGSSGGNPVIALNSDHANSNANPSIAIGAASYEGAGVFLGYDSGTAKASLVNSGGNRYLKWTGTDLEIAGSITVTGGNAATQDFVTTVGENAVTSGSVSAAAAQTAAELFAQSASANAVTSGSNAASTAQTNAQNFASTAAANAVVSGSNAASAAQSAAISQAQSDASASINLLANGNWTAGSGTFITSNSISSPVIAGNAGYISALFKVGPSGITLDGTNKKIFTGTGTYGNSNTPFYVDNNSNFSLGDKVTWDGTTFTVTGDIVGSDISGSIITGGLVSGSSFQGGSINIGEGAFTVDSLGFVSASNASIGGSIVTDDAVLGGWLVDENAITSEDGNVTLHATDEYIQVSDANGIPRATLSTDSTLPSPSSGGTNHTQGSSSSPINPSDQTRDVGPPSGLGNSDSDSGTLTHNLNSFTAGVSGAHSFSYTYSVSNRNFVSATGMMSSATMSIRVKIYSDASYSTLVGQTGTWSISAYGYDNSGGWSSVIGNTKILLADGTIKKAKDVIKNDKLLVWDYKTNQFVESNIKKINKRKVNNIYRVSLSNGLVVDVSDNHGFWLDNNEQIFVTQLIEGESKIYIKNDSDISLELVTKVEIINTEEEVFTFKIPNYENYISNGILSHNPSGGGFPENESNYMSATQNRSGTATLANGTTYYPRIECSYSLVTYGMGSYDTSREASLRFDHQGYFAVNSVSAGMTTNAAGFQVNSNDTKVFRLETSAGSADAFGTFIGGLSIDGLEHGRYLPMDTSIDTDSSYGIASSNRAKLDLYTWSYGAGRAQCTISFNESTNVATLENATGTDYACVNVDGITFTNINSEYNQSLRVNFITGPSSYKWTPLIMSYGRTDSSDGADADGIFNEESINNHAARMYPSDFNFDTNNSYCLISIRDNDGNAVRVPELLQLVCLG